MSFLFLTNNPSDLERALLPALMYNKRFGEDGSLENAIYIAWWAWGIGITF